MANRVILQVGTRRGLFVLQSDANRREWSISEPLLDGRQVFHAFVDPRDRTTVWAATRHAVWGAHVHRSPDLGGTWEVLEAAPHYVDERGLRAIWHLAAGTAPGELYAGIEPAGLFRSTDAGASWEPVSSLNEHKTNSTWQPSGGGLALHSIEVDRDDPKRMWCSISAGGVYRTKDGGKTWKPVNHGVRADYLAKKNPATGQCVHKVRSHPLRPERLYQVSHSGVYRSDDAGDSWIEITEGLPSDFGYALAIDPQDPDVAFVIPEESSHMRATVGGKLRVYRTRDGGSSWSTLRRGLPQEHAWVSILREAMDSDALDPCGVYFGTSTGHLFASQDRGESFRMIAGFLPPILSVTTAVV